MFDKKINEDDVLTSKKEKTAYKMAESLGKDAGEREIDEMEEKLPSMNSGPVALVWNKVMDIYNGFRSPDTPNSLKIFLVGALIYLVLPLDVIPDAIPAAGLLDDVAVLTFVWNKLNKIIKYVPKDILKVSVADKIQEKVKNGYNLAFSYAEQQLDKAIRKKANKTLYNCIISLGIFFVAFLFISMNTEVSILIASLLILFLFIRSLVSFIKVIPKSFKFIKHYFKKKNVDSAIASYLKETYSFIAPLENMKNKVRIFEDVPDLEIMVKMQRKALVRTIVEVLITLALVMTLFFVLRRYLFFRTSYTFISLVTLPFIKFYSMLFL